MARHHATCLPMIVCRPQSLPKANTCEPVNGLYCFAASLHRCIAACRQHLPQDCAKSGARGAAAAVSSVGSESSDSSFISTPLHGREHTLYMHAYGSMAQPRPVVALFARPICPIARPLFARHVVPHVCSDSISQVTCPDGQM